MIDDFSTREPFAKKIRKLWSCDVEQTYHARTTVSVEQLLVRKLVLLGVAVARREIFLMVSSKENE
jgi:hypothetical protein